MSKTLGNTIELDVPKRRLELLVEPAEIARRLTEAPAAGPPPDRGYRHLYASERPWDGAANHVVVRDSGRLVQVEEEPGR